MISKVEGIVLDTSNKFVVVGVGGIGLKVFVTEAAKLTSKKGEKISLFTHLAVKEDALDLYGFQNKEELDFFEMIISISGIGPKTAINVLNVSSVPVLRKAIATEDITHLVKVSGIGKKIAEKIVIELKDKIGAGKEEGEFGGQVDAMEALKSLGYSQKEARDALKEVSKHAVRTEDIVKEALRILGK